MQPEIALPPWGITARSGLWPVTIRVLFVIDGRIVLNKDEYEFGLGYVIDTLRATWSWWVGFEVDIVSREESISPRALGGNAVRFLNFSFTQPDFNIDRYDQIWFFGDQPNRTDGSDATTDADILPPYTLDDDEARLIAGWMDRGGGVFATGDHGVLGASLCSRLPRVRTMRRWRRSQGVPSVDGSRRHQTLQGGSSFLGEGDTLLQPIELVTWTTAHRLPFLRQQRPHPVMCSNWGPIDRFPDHMHEGDLIPDALVELDRPLEIPGHDRPEYPYTIPEFLAAGGADIGSFRWRPTPQIIAFGHTTNPYFPEDLAFATASPIPPGSVLLSKRFGLVSVYDGNPARVGRVVCDSTWHHWLSINLAGIATGDPYAYRKMQAYYRNVGLWLASETQRQSMLVSAVWGAMIGSWPGLFSSQQNAWEMGDRAVAVIENTMSPCALEEMVASSLDLSLRSLRYVASEAPSNPDWRGLSSELTNRAIVGSLCRSLFELAFEHRRALIADDRVAENRARIGECAARGFVEGRELLHETLADAATSFARLRDAFARGNDTSAS